MKYIIILLALLSFQTFAQDLHPDFHNLTLTEQDDLIFSDQATVITFEEWQTEPSIKEQILEALKAEGLDHFNIWGDTILGGDYSELGSDWELRDLSVVIIDGKAAAFSGLVANDAVYYGDDYCDSRYFYANDHWNEECVEKNKGEIRETFFIDTLGKSLWLKTNMYTDFYFDNGRTDY